MSTSNEYILDQGNTAVWIKNFVSNTKKNKALDTYTVREFELRLNLLESYWNKFDEKHTVLSRSQKDLTNEDYFTSDLFTFTQENYLLAKAWLLEQIQRLQDPVTFIPPTVGVPMYHQFGPQSRVPLEKIKIPPFSGDQSKWEKFKEKFISLVYNDKSMPLILKFQHLTNVLSGDAEKQLSGIKLLGENFETAWKTLCKRYDDNRLRFTRQMNLVVNLPAAESETPSHLNNLLNVTNESKNIFTALERPVEQWEDILV